MSEKTKKAGITALWGILDKYKVGATVVALDLTTAEGTIITFPDLAEGDTPKAGDKAEIDGKPAEGTITIVDNDGEYTYTFVGGILQEEQMTEDQQTIEALKAENEKLKADITAMHEEFTAVLATMTSEEPAQRRKTVTVKTETEPKTLQARLDDVKAKKNKF